MAAPASVYVNYGEEKFPIHLPGIIKQDCLLALHLEEYGDINEWAAKFGVNYLMFTKGGYIGMVIDDPGDHFYKRHHPSRFTNAKTKNKWGYKFRILNDFLNVRGTTSIAALGYADLDYFALEEEVEVKAAYYSGGTGGLQVSKFNPIISDYDWLYVPVNIADVSANTIGYVYPIEIQTIDYVTNPRCGDIIHYRFAHTNEEGEWTTSVFQKVIWASRRLFKFSSSYASYAKALPDYNTQTYITVYDIVGGRFVNKAIADDGVSEPGWDDYAPYGYYVDGETWYEWLAGNPIRSGRCIPGEYPDGDPANPPKYDEYYYFHSKIIDPGYPDLYSIQEGCLECRRGENTPRTIYKSRANSKYYTDSALTQLVHNRVYYTNYNSGMDFMWQKFANGEMVGSEGSCNNT